MKLLTATVILGRGPGSRGLVAVIFRVCFMVELVRRASFLLREHAVLYRAAHYLRYVPNPEYDAAVSNNHRFAYFT